MKYRVHLVGGKWIDFENNYKMESVLNMLCGSVSVILGRGNVAIFRDKITHVEIIDVGPDL